MGLINIVQHGKQRFFLPQETGSATACLEELIDLYPPDASDIGFLPEFEINTKDFTKEEPVQLPDWLVEPAQDAVSQLCQEQESLFDEEGAHIVDEVLTM